MVSGTSHLYSLCEINLMPSFILGGNKGDMYLYYLPHFSLSKYKRIRII